VSHEINCFKHYTPISYQQQGDVREESSSDDHQHQRPGEPEAQSPKVKPEEAQEQRLWQTVCPEPRVPSPEPRAPSIAVFSWPTRMLESHFCSPTKRKGLQRIRFVIPKYTFHLARYSSQINPTFMISEAQMQLTNNKASKRWIVDHFKLFVHSVRLIECVVTL